MYDTLVRNKKTEMIVTKKNLRLNELHYNYKEHIKTILCSEAIDRRLNMAENTNKLVKSDETEIILLSL